MDEQIRMCRTDEVPADGPLIRPLKRMSIGIFRLNGGFRALLNNCPHRGAPLCRGPVMAAPCTADEPRFTYHRARELVRCPWHGWDFDIENGACLADPAVRVRTFPVTERMANLDSGLTVEKRGVGRLLRHRIVEARRGEEPGGQ